MPKQRSNYGIVGNAVQPLASTTSGGVYGAIDVQLLKSTGQWVGVPTPPGNVVAATPGNASIQVTFTAPVSTGGSPITSYTVTSSPGNITGTGNASPVTVSGLTNGTAYTFTATANNSSGQSAASSASNSLKAGIYGTFENPTTGNVLYNLSSVSLTTSGYYLFTPFANCNVRIQLWGGGGGGLLLPGGTTTVAAGAGGYVEANVALVAETQYVVLVGAAGILGAATPPSIFPDGGSSNANNQLQGTGGGSSRFGPYVQSGFNITNSAGNYNNTNAVYWLIAGGGGGTTGYCSIGTAQSFGGGLTGSAGNSYFNGGEVLASCGGAGTQSQGGAGGTGGRLANGSAGAKYSGGFGTGGGGGGGYYGGGGAAGYYAVGGGGSGYIHSVSSVTSGLFYTASAGANNYISPNPRSNKPGSAGNGNNPTATVSSGNAGAMIMSLL